MPSDVRKIYDLPEQVSTFLGLALMLGRGPKDFERGLNGGGTAATARQAAEPRVKSPT